ncbi:hypothetical protein BJ986_003121 [Phycicoccus badiiscoriae]|uniref:Uncharacterized protein n=1 Tax=Pedococcus badiiscoriae TaxID=642776 RepID=A0A852WP33_9MICO|nr:hypothetical protein [Pedococcus badiiscoriae]NYG08634.1 hypothetical protein [Pedococcus badiiscoriae]
MPSDETAPQLDQLWSLLVQLDEGLWRRMPTTIRGRRACDPALIEEALRALLDAQRAVAGLGLTHLRFPPTALSQAQLEDSVAAARVLLEGVAAEPPSADWSPGIERTQTALTLTEQALHARLR